MNKVCDSCANYRIGMINFIGVYTPSCCTAGNHTAFAKWRDENGRKMSSNDVSSMECHKNTELGEILDNADRILDVLRRITNNQNS